MKFFPSDFDRDMKAHPLEIRGAWITILNHLWNTDRRGQAEYSIQMWARILGESEDKTNNIVCYIERYKIADVTSRNGNITIISRRMKKEDKQRENTRLRVSKFRDKNKNEDSNDFVTGQKLEVRSQKSEKELKAEHDPVDNSEQDEAPPPPKAALSQDQKEHLNRLAILITSAFRGFNPYAFIQKNLRSHPEAIIKTFQRMIEDKEKIKSPWPWAERVLAIESKNFNEQDFQKESEQHNSIYHELISAFQKMKGG